MIIGVLSDIHDNLFNLEKALDSMLKQKAETLIFCGDFCSPFAAKMLGETLLPIHAVFGNNDGDRFNILNISSQFANFRIHGEYIGDTSNQLILDGIKIGVTHYPFYAKTMVKTGWYDCVFYGNSHKADKQKFSNDLLMNPGEIAGIFGKPSYGLLDTQLRSSEIHEF